MDYYWDVFQRTGNLGLGQLAVDMYETERHGKLSVIAPLGPTVSQLYDYASKGVDGLPGNLRRSVPAYPLVFSGWDLLNESNEE
jgi:hypothetical protein